MYDQILYEVDDPVATITLNRPDRLNAWTGHMAGEVKDAVGRAQRDKAVVGIVITGAGRAFCAGADMNDLQTLSGDGPEGDDADRSVAASDPGGGAEAGDPSWGEDLQGTYTYLMSVPKPVIAAVNGAVAGMAFPISLCCDLRFGSRSARFLTAFAKRGLIAEWGLSWLLPRQVGTSRALDLLFSSRTVQADEALQLGLLDRVFDDDSLLADTRAYVEQLASEVSPASLAVMKRQVHGQLASSATLGPSEREAIELMVESFGRPDFREGVQSFLQKRPPSFARLGDD